MPNTILAATEAFIKAKFLHEPSGHDWEHINRVRNNALLLSETEGGDHYLIELAALLHDIADWKFANGSDSAGPHQARQWLSAQGEKEENILAVEEIIRTISYKGAGVQTPMATIEGAIVQDADRLDAIGATGIARTFAYGGFKNQPMHDPEHLPTLHADFSAYKAAKGTTINHFYEKLLLLVGRMQTKTGTQMAEEQTKFMQQFLGHFLAGR